VIGEHADTATSTTPTEVKLPAANDKEPAEPDPIQELEASNDNSPAEEFPATGTEQQ
jgi:hypothetical protein